MPAYPHKTQKKIAYKQAESGFINIEKWVPPFVQNQTGFGFVGVVAEDFKTEKLQCSECGKWFEQLPTHYSVAHKMTGEQYRAKFGLLNSTALKSKSIRLAQSALITKMQKDGRMNLGNRKNRNGKSYGFTKKNELAGNRKGIKKAVESQNKFGQCDLQIMTKMIALGKKLGKTPSLVDIKKEYGGGVISIMHVRYGSYIQYCKDYLKMEPLYSRYNPRPENFWKNSLLAMGKKALKKGKTPKAKGFLPEKESRYVYKYFKNFADYKQKLLAFNG